MINDIDALSQLLKSHQTPPTQSKKPILKQTKKPNPNDIWNETEILSTPIIDTRPEPKYTLTYKQNVDTSDIFLGMSNRSNSISDCDCLMLKVELDQVPISSVELDVKTDSVEVKCKGYKLVLVLPKNIHDQKSKATFCNGILSVEMPIKDLFE